MAIRSEKVADPWVRRAKWVWFSSWQLVIQVVVTVVKTGMSRSWNKRRFRLIRTQWASKSRSCYHKFTSQFAHYSAATVCVCELVVQFPGFLTNFLLSPATRTSIKHYASARWTRRRVSKWKENSSTSQQRFARVSADSTCRAPRHKITNMAS